MAGYENFIKFSNKMPELRLKALQFFRSVSEVQWLFWNQRGTNLLLEPIICETFHYAMLDCLSKAKGKLIKLYRQLMFCTSLTGSMNVYLIDKRLTTISIFRSYLK